MIVLTNHMKTFVFYNHLEKSSLNLCVADIGSFDFSFLRFSPPWLQPLLSVEHVSQSIPNSAHVTKRRLPKYPPQHLRSRITATSYPKGMKGNIISLTLYKLFSFTQFLWRLVSTLIEKSLSRAPHGQRNGITEFPRTANNGIKTHIDDERQALKEAFDN